jgi:polyribonucleotide nucleotidyltransferase
LLTEDANTRDQNVILTDILGLEDALGDMDLKVAGTTSGITAVQMDLKKGQLDVNTELREILQRAKQARSKILTLMADAIENPNKLKPSIPKLCRFSIPLDRVSAVIGPRGRTINHLLQTHRSIEGIDVGKDGLVDVRGFDTESNEAAKVAILHIVAEAERLESAQAMVPMIRPTVLSSVSSPPKGKVIAKSRASLPTAPTTLEFPSSPEEPKRASNDMLFSSTDQYFDVAHADDTPDPSACNMKIGEMFPACNVKSHHDFGVFVTLPDGNQGLVHISELDFKRVSA